jgi:uncharacterized protein (DUF2147 family)
VIPLGNAANCGCSTGCVGLDACFDPEWTWGRLGATINPEAEMKYALQSVMAALLLAPSLAFAQEQHQDNVWRNPQNSVHVRVAPCGKSRCGVVVWANDKAKADSARGGTPNLVGMNLFHDFQQKKPNVWQGKVFVPDMNRTFTGTITVEKDSATAKGCVLMICKSQTWTRVR